MLKGQKDHRSTQWWLILQPLPLIDVRKVPFFNRVDPRVWGIPFFFWYQLLCHSPFPVT